MKAFIWMYSECSETIIKKHLDEGPTKTFQK